VDQGMTQQDFDAVKNYLMKNVFVMTASQNEQIGYALDSRYYGTGEFTSFMREKLQTLTLDDVNRAVRKHLNAKDLSVVIITKDAEGLRKQLASDDFSPIKYDANKPQDLLDEDKVIGAKKLNIRPEAIRVIPVDEVFVK